MSREEFTRLLGPYLDGELSGEQRETVERYLAGSEEYRKLAAEAEELTRLAKNDRRGQRAPWAPPVRKRSHPSSGRNARPM